MCKFAIVTNHYIAYTLVNLKLTWRVCRYVSLFARLENITDARYTINRGYTMPGITAMGAMGRYVSTPNKHFQPMNCAFGLIDGLVVDKQHKKIRNKQERYTVISERSLAFMRDWSSKMYNSDDVSC